MMVVFNLISLNLSDYILTFFAERSALTNGTGLLKNG